MIIITFNNLKSRTTEPIQSNSTQITNPCSKHHISQIINNTSQNHENKTINMKYKESIEKPIPFCRSLKMKRWVTMEVFLRKTVCLREVLMGKTTKRHKMFEGKPKRFKNWPNYAKHAIFMTDLSHKQVAKVSCETLGTQKFWKFF